MNAVTTFHVKDSYIKYIFECTTLTLTQFPHLFTCTHVGIYRIGVNELTCEMYNRQYYLPPQYHLPRL